MDTEKLPESESVLHTAPKQGSRGPSLI